MLALTVSTALAQTSPRPGVPPQDVWTCPLTHPIKGNFTTYSGERCIYQVWTTYSPTSHAGTASANIMKGGQFYGKTKPERCFATEEDAVKDGCRRSKR
jgi:hypothetical protein